MRRAPLTAVMVCLVGLLGVPLHAAAQDVEQPTERVRLTVTQMTGVLGPGLAPEDEREAPTDLQVRVAIENTGDSALRDVDLVVETYRPLTSRSLLRQALDRGIIDDSRIVERIPVRSGAGAGDATSLLPGDIAGAALSISGTRLTVGGRSGIYPVQLSVVRGTTVLDRVVTGVIWLDQEPAAPLQTVLVWPLDDAPWWLPGDLFAEGVDREILAGRRLERLLRAIEVHQDVPVTLYPAPHLIEVLRERADGYLERQAEGDGNPRLAQITSENGFARRNAQFAERITEVTRATPLDPVASAYVDADLPAALSGPRQVAEDAGVLASEGAERLTGLVGRQADPATYLATGPMTSRALDVVPASHLVLSWSHILGPDLALDPNLPYPLRSLESLAGRRFTATVADPYLERLFAETRAAPHGPEVAVQRLLVETAMIFFELPGTPDRPLTMLPPLDWDPHPRVPSRLLDAFSDAPWLELVDPTTQLRRGNTDELERALLSADDRPAALDPLLRQAADTELDLDAVRAALPSDDVAGRDPARLQGQLLWALSAWFTRDDLDRTRALISDVAAAVDEAFGTVEVPEGGQILLDASGTPEFPITLRRTSGGPLRVRVTVAATGALSWPNGQTREDVLLRPESATTVSFATLARSSGTFPLDVVVTDPLGRRELDRARLSIRSTAISRPAIIGLGVLVVALLVIGTLRRRRPPRTEEPEPTLSVLPGGEGSPHATERDDG